MKVKKKEDVLKKFRSKGYELDPATEKDFYVDFRFFVNQLISDEITLLEELYRIQEKKERGEELSVIEQKFHSYLMKKIK
ncbi:hypothetical protein U8527_08640 [Kordia algicida OT-1]|uniref:Uncharacterized protein n=1 Tax=Kordia algicida OT-1 TaxID=391587 RepID=A9E6T1_9FLAO|nr:hypothetical protein [Kordia algicida]EDP95082.1 hypothetical protein KAOT1_02064 [Kordia algicida OT-1]